MDDPVAHLRAVAIYDGISSKAIENHGVVFPYSKGRWIPVLGNRGTPVVVEAHPSLEFVVDENPMVESVDRTRKSGIHAAGGIDFQPEGEPL